MPPGQSFLTGFVPYSDMSGLVLYNAGGGSGSSVSLDFYNTNYHGGIPQAKIKAIDDGNFSDHLLFLTKTPGTYGNPVLERVRITSAGNVGIGTATPQHTLSVNGSIGALEVIVVSSGADYVFEPGYHLQPLSEVSTYIESNHHLPGVPAAAEGLRNGVGLGAMQTTLLAKIEELTLHMIRENQRNDRLEQENREFRERIARLEGRRLGAGEQK